MNKFSLRAGGLSPLIIYVCLLSFLLIGFLGNLSVWNTTGTFDWSIFSFFAGMMLFLVVSFTWSFLLIRVEINGDDLFVKQVQRFVQKKFLSIPLLLPKNYPVHVPVKEIESVYIGELGKIEEKITSINSKRVNEFFGYYHDTSMSLDPGNSLIRMPRWIVAKYMPIIFIQTKNSKDSFIFSAKPFSRRGLVKFVKLLRSKGVGVITQKYFNLES